jgi:hypothetical protein
MRPELLSTKTTTLTGNQWHEATLTRRGLEVAQRLPEVVAKAT